MRKVTALCLTVLMCIGVAAVPTWATSVSPSPSSSTGTVVVTVDLAAAAGSEVAAILYLDPEVSLETAAGLNTGFGSFVADVTADPFTVTETIREGTAWLDEPPMTDQPVASVPPGEHTLAVYVSRRLGPFGEFVPAAPLNWACFTGVTVRPGERTDLDILVPPFEVGSGYLDGPTPACETVPQDAAPAAGGPDISTTDPGDAAQDDGFLYPFSDGLYMVRVSGVHDMGYTGWDSMREDDGTITITGVFTGGERTTDPRVTGRWHWHFTFTHDGDDAGAWWGPCGLQDAEGGEWEGFCTGVRYQDYSAVVDVSDEDLEYLQGTKWEVDGWYRGTRDFEGLVYYAHVVGHYSQGTLTGIVYEGEPPPVLG